MARTKGTKRGPALRARATGDGIRHMDQFEKLIRKYYPKKSRFFYGGSHYQPSCANNFNNPNSLVPQRYKRDFFRSFYAEKSPSHIPHNLQCLTIFSGSQIILRKLIKQNKRLKHLVLESEKRMTNVMVVKILKYSKSLRSITFKHAPPYFSEEEFSDKECQKMSRTWGKTLEVFKSSGKAEYHFQDFKRAIETILKFPNLKALELPKKIEETGFPFDQLQERKIAYNILFYINTFNSLIEKFPRCKPTGNVIILFGPSYDKSVKMLSETGKFQKESNQTLALDLEKVRYDRIPLRPVFQKISSLDLTAPGHQWNYSSLGQLKNLKHLSLKIHDQGEGILFGDFFNYLNKNVAPYQKLETFLVKSGVWEQKKPTVKPVLSFFEACSETLRKVHFELKYHSADSEEAECFYEGLSKLKNLQSLSLFLDFQAFKSKKTIEKLCERISEIESLEELDVKIQKKNHQEKAFNLKFPQGLKRLSLGMDTSSTAFVASKTLESLSNLLQLELEFTDFSSAKWSKILHDLADKLKLLEVLTLKKTEQKKEKTEMKERLDAVMTESSNLKLIIFANMEKEEMSIFRRSHYPWSEINLIMNDLSFKKDMKVKYIKSYQ